MKSYFSVSLQILHGVNLVHNSISAAFEIKSSQGLHNLDAAVVTLNKFPTVSSATPSSLTLAQKLLSEVLPTVKQLSCSSDTDSSDDENRLIGRAWVPRLVLSPHDLPKRLLSTK